MKGKRILNIGPRFTKGAARSGGIVVLFENWLTFCETQSVTAAIVDNNKKNYAPRVLAPLIILCKSVASMRRADVVFFNGTYNDYLYLAPFVILFGKLLRRKVVMRKFAGNFLDKYQQAGWLHRKMLDFTVNHADFCFWETQVLTKHYNSLKPDRNAWFPNVRSRTSSLRHKGGYQGRYIFLSGVQEQKGIEYLKEAFTMLGEGYHIDIFGPLYRYTEQQLQGANYAYLGPVDYADVYRKLAEYDVLVLPTYWTTEGYPGIILEAFSVGIPVIASRIGGIPELIADGHNGLLIAPQSAAAIVEAVRVMERADYEKMANEAYKSFDAYDETLVNPRVLDTLYALCAS